jgi:hypothetical protein
VEEVEGLLSLVHRSLTGPHGQPNGLDPDPVAVGYGAGYEFVEGLQPPAGPSDLVEGQLGDPSSRA